MHSSLPREPRYAPPKSLEQGLSPPRHKAPHSPPRPSPKKRSECAERGLQCADPRKEGTARSKGHGGSDTPEATRSNLNLRRSSRPNEVPYENGHRRRSGGAVEGGEQGSRPGAGRRTKERQGLNDRAVHQSPSSSFGPTRLRRLLTRNSLVSSESSCPTWRELREGRDQRVRSLPIWSARGGL